ncbi:MAG: protease complex subunit PrcB family protein [Candidatus Bathyarchaeota archaeon]|nr:protease complex subunit PrcB family protein [Candidatus Bathyarchaeota archaeon]
MQHKKLNCVVFFLLLAAIHTAALQVHASEPQELDFEVIAWGDQSGYVEETFLVARTEAEWIAIWEKHALFDMSSVPYPEILFSEKMVVCAFMGRCPTTGYSISIEEIWLEADNVRVELAKHNPRNQSLVGQMLTHPYVIASLKNTDAPVIFDASEETGMNQEPLIPELYFSTATLTTFLVFSSFLVALARKASRHKQ